MCICSNGIQGCLAWPDARAVRTWLNLAPWGRWGGPIQMRRVGSFGWSQKGYLEIFVQRSNPAKAPRNAMPPMNYPRRPFLSCRLWEFNGISSFKLISIERSSKTNTSPVSSLFVMGFCQTTPVGTCWEVILEYVYKFLVRLSFSWSGYSTFSDSEYSCEVCSTVLVDEVLYYLYWTSLSGLVRFCNTQLKKGVMDWSSRELKKSKDPECAWFFQMGECFPAR